MEAFNKRFIIRKIAFSLIFLVLLCLFQVNQLSTHNQLSAQVKNTKFADTLKGLGLFKGTAHGYELAQPLTRDQGTVMALRLLGLERTAEEANLKNPFKDVKTNQWSSKYVAYAFHLGLVKGTTSTTFSPNKQMNAKEFMTLVLRAQEYGEAEPNIIDQLAITSQLMTKPELDSILRQKVFMRDEVVFISYKALSTKLRDKELTLLQKLVEVDKTISLEKALASGLYAPSRKSDAKQPVLPQKKNQSDEPMDRIEEAIKEALREK